MGSSTSGSVTTTTHRHDSSAQPSSSTSMTDSCCRSSSSTRSLEKRLTMRPSGVVSKKAMVAALTERSRSACSVRLPLRMTG
ncbi:hypothetical protein NESM_000937400 [Novymonas esmeraldas]|uniref:Uncharacterized protein n=1 Tax=Novymonas esmeraldas TaxID=1808958 RepID=A0AAW0F1V3_9TRYP